MPGVINRIKNRARAQFKQKPKQVPFSWRTVEQGPLKGATVFVPEQGSWGDDVITGTYESEFFSALQEPVKNGGCLYDIGGHVGIFSLAWLKMGGVFVETFEPLPANAHLIAEVLDNNGYQHQYNVHQLALGDSTVEGTLLKHKSDTSRGQILELDNISTSSGTQDDNQYKQSVQIAQLDTLYDEEAINSPTIMKIDVEGAERNVLVGAVRILERFRPIILTEIHNSRSALEVSALLSNMSYVLTILGAKGARQTMPLCQWIPEEKFTTQYTEL